MIKSGFVVFLQGLPTRQSVSTANLAPTVQSKDLPAALHVLLIVTPTRVPQFAMSVTQTNTQVCLFAFLHRLLTEFLQTVTYTLYCFNAYMWLQSLFLSLDINVSPHPHPLWLFVLTCSLFFQSLVQEAAKQDLHVQTVTTSTHTHPATLRDR